MKNINDLMFNMGISFDDDNYTLIQKWNKLSNAYKNNDNKLLIKALIDPYYKEMLKKYNDLNLLLPGGFFDDGLDVGFFNYKEDFLTTSIHKILNNFKNIENDKEFVVMLNTGSYSPVHFGHIQMMELAYKELCKKYNVLGGFLSPSHDKYVSQKYGGSAKLNAVVRIDLCETMVYDHPYLMIDPWESLYNDVSINFTNVIIHLKKLLSKYINKKIKIAYVFGSDNAGFSWAFLKDDISVCIERPGYELQFNIVKNDINMSDNNYFLNSNYNHSSKELREGNNSLTSDFVYKKYNLFKNDNFEIQSKNYLIRDDFHISSPFSISQKNYAFFISGFSNALINSFKPYTDIQPIFLDTEIQQEIVNKFNYNLNQIVNADLWTQNKNHIPLNITRLFNICDGQISTDIIINRYNSSKINEQLKNVSDDFIFIDDDIVSGKTLELIQKFTKFKVIKKISLSEEYLKFKNLELNFHDIVDIRDFLIGFKQSGLTVKLNNGKIVKAPYLMPYVCLTTRAKIPHSNQKQFSINIWKLNQEFYNNIDQNIKIKDLDTQFQIFCKELGFNFNMKISDFCEFHINNLG